MELFRDFKKLSITSFLSDRGITPEEKRNSTTWFSSPFSSDRSPSFVVYEKTNSFYDWSNGKGGDIISLVQLLENCSPMEAIEILSSGNIIPIHNKYSNKVKPDNKSFKNFNYKKYLLSSKDDIIRVKKYASSRKIKSDYLCGQFWEKKSNKDINDWMGIPSIMFIHRDEDFDICGVKFREINPRRKRRFNSRGRLCYYVLKNITTETPKVYIVESETSANSLLNICKEFNISCFILCVGGVHSVPDRLPVGMNEFECNVIIDYDGDEAIYQERLNRYKHFGKDIKIKLQKGEDLNSLYCENKYKFLKDLL